MWLPGATQALALRALLVDGAEHKVKDIAVRLTAAVTGVNAGMCHYEHSNVPAFVDKGRQLINKPPYDIQPLAGVILSREAHPTACIVIVLWPVNRRHCLGVL